MKQEHGRRTRAKAKERTKTLQTVFWVGLILVQMTVVNCLQTRAETGEKLAQRNVEKEVRYENMEGAAQLPETIDVEVQEGGQTVTVCCTRQESRILREHWEADFRFPVVFHSYDADYYMVGERLIAHKDGQPNLADCEDELLNLIGVTPEEYRIENIEWAGEAYPDADGNLCREALAKGSRLLRDYQVRYVGAVQLPDPGDGAAQEEEESAEESAEEFAGESEEVTGAETTPPGVVITPPEAEQTNEAEALDFWQKLTRTLLITIGIGALLFFGGLLFLLVLRLVKTARVCYNERKRKEKEKYFMYTENKDVKVNDLGGGVTRKILSYSEKLMTVELHFQKGAVGAKHSHPHEQIGYIVSGRLIYQEEGCADKELQTGDTYYVKPDAVHGIQVLEDTVLLDIFTPMRKDFVE